MAECNPRPKSQRGTSILEVQIFKKHYSDIIDAIQNPDTVTDQLFSAGILEEEIASEVHHASVINQKNRILLKGVKKAISAVPNALYKFLKILKAHSTTEYLARSIGKTVLCPMINIHFQSGDLREVHYNL